MNDLKIGIIGFDTSHVISFTDVLNNPDHEHHVPGGRVVAGYPGGSPDMPLSRDRLDGFKKELTDKYRIKICDSISDLLPEVDAVLLESVDGRVHLKQFSQLTEAGKPVFIDKPFTVSVGEAKEIRRLSRESNVPLFSSSAVRFDVNIQKELCDEESGRLIGAEAYGHAEYESTQPGLFWYGIHSAEILFTMMGAGCGTVSCFGNDKVDLVVGKWKDGRIGVLRGIRDGHKEFGCLVYREKVIRDVKMSSEVPLSAMLMKKVMKFFQTRVPPVSLEETVEIIAFIDAANRSKAAGGKEMRLDLGSVA